MINLKVFCTYYSKHGKEEDKRKYVDLTVFRHGKGHWNFNFFHYLVDERFLYRIYYDLVFSSVSFQSNWFN